jgi:putative transposase
MVGYDYSRSGAYFVTVCSLRRERLFGWVSGDVMVENANASMMRECWLDLPDHYPRVSLDAFVIMPDHIHGILILTDNSWAGLKPAPTGAGTRGGVRHGLPEIVRALKTYSARRINAARGTPGTSVWQRGYYERIIRNERELNLTRKYITKNPRNWQSDREHANPPPQPHPPRRGGFQTRPEPQNPCKTPQNPRAHPIRPNPTRSVANPLSYTPKRSNVLRNEPRYPPPK